MLIVCAGTGTDVGKTWVGAQVLAATRGAGLTVAARKPAQSFDLDDPRPTDAAILGGATGEHPDLVCRPDRNYPIAMAPPMAADALGLPAPTLADLIAELTWPAPAPDLCWVESVGGVRSPLTDDADTVDLCHRLLPDLVVLVADAGLGTINDVRLASAALHPHTVVVLLNRFDPANGLHQANRQWLADRDNIDTATDCRAVVRRVQAALRSGTGSSAP